MPLKEHLLEFRNRLMIAAAAVVVGTVLGWVLSGSACRLVRRPLGSI